MPSSSSSLNRFNFVSFHFIGSVLWSKLCFFFFYFIYCCYWTFLFFHSLIHSTKTVRSLCVSELPLNLLLMHVRFKWLFRFACIGRFVWIALKIIWLSAKFIVNAIRKSTAHITHSILINTCAIHSTRTLFDFHWKCRLIGERLYLLIRFVFVFLQIL